MELRFGLIGGSEGSFIGKIHRYGGQFDSKAILTAGCFSRNIEKNEETGKKWNIPTDRVYADFRQMAEAESLRPDGIDFVSIATPNANHYEMAKAFLLKGISVVCDKPVTINVEQGEALQKIADEKDLFFCVTYSYSGFPMVHEMRSIIASGKLGKIQMVNAEYPQDGRLKRIQAGTDKTDWHFFPEIGGPSGAGFDIGTHVEYTTRFVTGLKIKSVIARMEHTYGSTLDTGGSAIIEYEDGTQGLYWFSQAAAGNDNNLRIRVYGEFGNVEWSHRDAYHLILRMINSPVQIYSVNEPYLSDDAKSLSRIKPGHYEGFIEAFSNIYNRFITALAAKKEGKPYKIDFPTLSDGIESIRFIEACLKSDENGNTRVKL